MIGLWSDVCWKMTLWLTESERELQRVVGEFHRVYTRRKLTVNVGKISVGVSEKSGRGGGVRRSL